MQAVESMQKVEFINETFSPTEAKNVISKVIDDQINYCKLQDLTCHIQHDKNQHDILIDRISQMKQKKQQLSQIMEEAEASGLNVKLSCDFDISLTD